MAERLPNTIETDKNADPDMEAAGNEALRQLHEKASESRHDHAERLDEIRQTAEREAASAKDTERKVNPNELDNDRPLHINRELKKMAYDRTLKRTRNRLPVYSRPLSRIIHNPVVETASEIGAKTIARPSGIQAGGVTAFLGSSLFLWVARHYGYDYNFLLFVFLFTGGFFVGLIIELALRLIRRR